MQKLEVFGANKLRGQIKISGSKNASLPILAATLLAKKKITLKNLPKVRDIETMLKLLKSLGSKIRLDKRVAARIGREAFLEPEILICPLSLFAPKTSNFCIVILLVELHLFDPYIFHLCPRK